MPPLPPPPHAAPQHAADPAFAQLVVRDLTRSIGGRVIHDSLNFTVSSGETLFITGPSGVGKSLLLRTLAYLGKRVRDACQLAASTADCFNCCRPAACHHRLTAPCEPPPPCP